MVCMATTTVFDLFIISYDQAGASFVSYRHTSFIKNHSYQNNFVHNYQVRGHTSFLVFCLKRIHRQDLKERNDILNCLCKKRDLLWRSEFQYGSQTHEMLNIGPYKKKCFKDLSLEPLNH